MLSVIPSVLSGTVVSELKRWYRVKNGVHLTEKFFNGKRTFFGRMKTCFHNEEL